MTLISDVAHKILREAVNSEVGIAVKVEAVGDVMTPVLRAKQVLYRFKQEDADFANIQIRVSPDNPDTELWLINNGPKIGTEN